MIEYGNSPKSGQFVPKWELGSYAATVRAMGQEEKRKKEEQERQKKALQAAVNAAVRTASTPERNRQRALSIAQSSSENAQSEAERTKQALQVYLGSQEREQARKQNNQTFTQRLQQLSMGTSVADAPLGTIHSLMPEDQKETVLRAHADRAKELARQEKDSLTMAQDLELIRNLPQEDRAALERYIIARNTQGNDFTKPLSLRNPEYEEKALFDKYGRQKVMELAESYSRNQNRENAQQAVQQGQNAPSLLASNITSVGANLLGNLTSPLGRISEVGQRTGRYETLDPNAPGELPGTYAAAVRERTAKEIEEGNGIAGKVGSTVYQAGMGAADNLLRAVTGGGGKAMPLLLAGLGSFGQNVTQASAQGASPMQAAAMGAAGAALEVGTEYLPLEGLLDSIKAGKAGTKNLLRNVLRQAGLEAAEEEISYLGGVAAENGILGGNSRYQQSIQQALEKGESLLSARQSANREVLNEAVRTAVLSALSGGISAGAGQISGAAASRLAAFQKADTQTKPGQAPKTQTQESAPQAQVPAPRSVPQQAQAEGIKAAGDSTPVTETARAITAAMEQLRSTGAVTNKTAQNLMDNPEAAQVLTRQTGIEIKGTASQKRGAVKQAVAQLLSRQAPAQAENSTAAEMAAAPAAVQEQAQRVQAPTGQAAAENAGIPATQAKTVRADESVGAAPAGFDRLSEMMYQYGNLPEGEKPARVVDLPVSTDGKDRVSLTARTVAEAQATPDAFIPDLEQEVVKGKLSYIPITNDATTQKAAEQVRKVGWNDALAQWSADVRSGRSGADMTAMGAVLLNNAAAAGDKQTWLNVLHDYRKLVTNTAQGLQAARILKQLEPEDQLYMMEKSIDEMVREMHLQQDIEIDPDLRQAYEDAESDEEKDAALRDIQQNVADQIPSTLADKWNALRYVNMLGNFRTQIRNVVGNAASSATYMGKDAIAATLEKLALPQSQRTKAMGTTKQQRAAAAEDFTNVRQAVQNGGKYNDPGSQSDEFKQAVMDKRRIFKNPVLEKYRTTTNWAMEAGDEVFSKAAYARALAGWLKARGIAETDYSKIDPAVLDEGRAYAVQQAQEATFRDNNAFSSWISGFMRDSRTPKVLKPISEGILPFRKTPANVLLRAEEYSPVGIVNSALTAVKAAKGEATGAQLVESLAKTLTGTGLYALGWLLGDLGLLTGGPDEDEDKQYFDELNGYQNYALQVGDRNFTIDFLSPMAIPMFLGAQTGKIVGSGGYSFADFEAMFTSLADPLIEMSMLQGVNDTLESMKYGDNNIGQLLLNATMSYLTQGLTNSLAGQIERGLEGKRMSTYVDKDSSIPQWLQRQIGKMSAKTPFLDYQQMPYVDAWGQEEPGPTGSKLGDLAYNLFSPSYADGVTESEAAEELYRLNEAQSDYNVFPQQAEQTLSYTDKEGNRKEGYNLSMEQLEQIRKTEGKKQAELVAQLVKSEDYQALGDREKAKAVSLCYDYAREHARVETLEDYGGYSDSWMTGENTVQTVVDKVAADQISGAFDALTEKWREDNTDTDSRQAVEKAYGVYQGLSADAQKRIAEGASGRVKHFLTAKTEGIETGVFLDAYKTYWSIDQDDSKSASEKQNQFAYELEKAVEAGTMTDAQRDQIRQSLKYFSQIPGSSAAFDKMTEGGMSADNAAKTLNLLEGLPVLEGRSEVSDFQKAESITKSGLKEQDKRAALYAVFTDAQDAKLDKVLGMGLDAADYVAAWQIGQSESGKGRKARMIEAYREQFQVDYETAAALYELFG